MNPSLFAAFAAALLAATWLTSRRRPRPFLRSDDTSAVAALNRAQIALITVRPSSPPPAPAPDPVVFGPTGVAGRGALPELWPELPGASSARQRLALVRQLERWSQGSPDDRLRAMALARRWRHRCLLPLLHRGLRDPDPLVMAEAASVMQAFRGRSPGPVSQVAVAVAAARSRPRTVLRTR
ncbi:MAG: hypothetical protein NTY67_03970 [Cyanobacteria bacterium]|nr:hypothetical protein [Cyanobacteriota bacterium]